RVGEPTSLAAMKFSQCPSCLALIVICIMLMAMESAAAPNCDTEGDGDVNPETCKYGAVRNWCRKLVCAKGPGEVCGGRWMQHGTCGTGTYCNCNRCLGCSSFTLECYAAGQVC
ncbi:unnamed protein product, partial [Meganyctiphanes norvegica]